jgi:TonB family protein
MLNPLLDRRAPSRRALFAVGAVLLLVTIPLASVRARQAGPAAFSGTVYDVSGAVVPGVTVTLLDANEVASTAHTDASGRFEFPVVAPGAYVLAVNLPGFRALRQNVELRQSRDWDRTITLQIGGLEETVLVRVTRRITGSQTTAVGPVRVGGSVRPPKKIKDVRPSYPPSMVAAGLGGVVPLEALIGQDGSVISVRVLTAPAHPDLANAAMDAVRQWRFTPTLLNGQPVEVAMTVRVTFDVADAQ